MFSIMKQGNRATTYVNEYVVDTLAEINDLPTTASPGSVCLVVETSDVYMLNNDKQWKIL